MIHIPPVVMYILSALLMGFGLYRLNLGRPTAARGRLMHLVFGALYVAMGVYLILTTARVIPAPRFGPRPAPTAPEELQPIPARPIPVRPLVTPPASAPTTAPTPR
jgi:hypothetical protein